MRKTNKKGFTIVELVIVIAVIAVLAAVLIPTFSSLVKKANVASDTTVAKNMNTALAEYSTLNGVPETFEEVLDAIEEYGYVLANLNAKAEGNLYGWDKENNQIVYIDAEGKTVYKNKDFDPAKLQIVVSGDTSVTLPDGYTAPVLDMSKPAGPKAFKQALEDGKSVTLSADFAVSSVIEIEDDVTIDLNGHNLNATAVEARPFSLSDGAKLTIKGGNETVSCGLYGLVNVKANAAAEVKLEGGVYTGNLLKGAFIKVREGESDYVKITLNNVTYTDESDETPDSYILNASGYDGTLDVIVNGGTYTSTLGFQGDNITVKNATITTQGFAVLASNKATIEGCNITSNGKYEKDLTGDPNAGVYAACIAVEHGAEATVTNCTLTYNKYEAATKQGAALLVLTSGGKIVTTGTTITGEQFLNTVEKLYDGMEKTVSYIKINDAEPVVNLEYKKQ